MWRIGAKGFPVDDSEVPEGSLESLPMDFEDYVPEILVDGGVAGHWGTDQFFLYLKTDGSLWVMGQFNGRFHGKGKSVKVADHIKQVHQEGDSIFILDGQGALTCYGKGTGWAAETVFQEDVREMKPLGTGLIVWKGGGIWRVPSKPGEVEPSVISQPGVESFQVLYGKLLVRHADGKRVAFDPGEAYSSQTLDSVEEWLHEQWRRLEFNLGNAPDPIDWKTRRFVVFPDLTLGIHNGRTTSVSLYDSGIPVSYEYWMHSNRIPFHGDAFCPQGVTDRDTHSQYIVDNSLFRIEGQWLVLARPLDLRPKRFDCHFTIHCSHPKRGNYTESFRMKLSMDGKVRVDPLDPRGIEIPPP